MDLVPNSRFRSIVYAMLPLLALIGAAELIARALPGDDTGTTASGYAVEDPDLIWRLAPRSQGDYRTNELGLRDTTYKADADVKILVLGDSVAWGDAIDDVRNVFANRLERRLDDEDPSRTYEVINAGVPGYSTFQEAAFLRIRGLALAPDLVILQFCLNDIVERYHRIARFGGESIFLGVDTRHAGSDLLGSLIRHSRAFERFFRFLMHRSRKREEYAVRNLASDELSPALEEAWELVIEEVEDVRRTAASNGIPLLLVIAPYRFQLEEQHRLRQPQDRLIEYASSRAVTYVDLLPVFATARKFEPSRPLFIDPSHFSVAGHEIAAAALFGPVKALLGPTGAPEF